MSDTNRIAATAALLGDPARANMLAALLDGRALTAKELAYAAHVTPQTASGHLAKLADGGLLAAEKQGRHRYYRLASPLVGQMLEGVMAVTGPEPARATTWRGGEALRTARTCYDHLAGRLGVALADALSAQGHVALGTDGGEVTEQGQRFLDDSARRRRRGGACSAGRAWTGASGGRISPAGWARRWRAGASNWAGSRGSATRARWRSRRRGGRGFAAHSGSCWTGSSGQSERPLTKACERVRMLPVFSKCQRFRGTLP